MSTILGYVTTETRRILHHDEMFLVMASHFLTTDCGDRAGTEGGTHFGSWEGRVRGQTSERTGRSQRVLYLKPSPGILLRNISNSRGRISILMMERDPS